MQFRMHESGLHLFDPRDQEFTFFNTIFDNKEGFTARQTKSAEVDRALYATLIYHLDKDYKWAILSNQIKKCPVTVHDVEVAQEACGKKISELEGKTSGQVSSEDPCSIDKVSQGSLPHMQHIFCE